MLCGAQGSTGVVRDWTGGLSAAVRLGEVAAAAAATVTAVTLAVVCLRDEKTCTPPLLP